MDLNIFSFMQIHQTVIFFLGIGLPVKNESDGGCVLC